MLPALCRLASQGVGDAATHIVALAALHRTDAASLLVWEILPPHTTLGNEERSGKLKKLRHRGSFRDDRPDWDPGYCTRETL